LTIPKISLINENYLTNVKQKEKEQISRPWHSYTCKKKTNILPKSNPNTAMKTDVQNRFSNFYNTIFNYFSSSVKMYDLILSLKDFVHKL